MLIKYMNSSWCEKMPIEGPIFKCENCFYFYFCEQCNQKKDNYKSNLATSHKFYHSFVLVNEDK